MNIIMNTAIIVWLFLNLSYTAFSNEPYIDEEEITWNEPQQLCGPTEILTLLLKICPDIPKNTMISIADGSNNRIHDLNMPRIQHICCKTKCNPLHVRTYCTVQKMTAITHISKWDEPYNFCGPNDLHSALSEICQNITGRDLTLKTIDSIIDGTNRQNHKMPSLYEKCCINACTLRYMTLFCVLEMPTTGTNNGSQILDQTIHKPSCKNCPYALFDGKKFYGLRFILSPFHWGKVTNIGPPEYA